MIRILPSESIIFLDSSPLIIINEKDSGLIKPLKSFEG